MILLIKGEESIMVTENLKIVEDKIANACARANRERREVTLIAVSKTKPVEMIQEAMNSEISQKAGNTSEKLKMAYDWSFTEE